MWSEIISPRTGPFLTPENDSNNMIGTSLNWLFLGSQKIVIWGVCYKMVVRISKFVSLENGGGKIVKNGDCQEFLAKSQKNT